MVPASLRLAGVAGAALLAIAAVRCGSNAPSGPSSTSPSVTSVQVGVAGNAPAQLAPGESKQLFATATSTDGTTSDVTNLATWQSSNPALATVSAGGLLTAAAEGPLDVFATYKNVRGMVHAEVRRCALSLSPASATFTAFGGTQSVDVTASSADCKWTAASDASWFPFSIERTGNASFTYTLPSNSTTTARSANIIAAPSGGGTAATHAIIEARPVSCSYITSPEERTFTAAGGTASFDVITTPSDCHWNASTTLYSFGVYLVSGYSGTGNGRVTYTVPAHTRTVDIDGYIEIAGLSGLNPPGRHHVIVLKR